MSTTGAGDESIGRDAVSPFLFKLFYKNGRHNSVDDFHPLGPNPPHIEIYTWLDATIDELAQLVTLEIPQQLPDPVVGTRLDFEVIFPDMRSLPKSDGYGGYTKKPLGTIVIGASNLGRSKANGNNSSDAQVSLAKYITGDENKTLQDAKFVIGDYIDVAIYPPNREGEIAPGPRIAGQRNAMFPRENGFGRPQFSNGRRGAGGDQWSGGVPAGDWRRGDPVPSPPPSSGPSRRGGGSRGRW